jgi:hypothetical protein
VEGASVVFIPVDPAKCLPANGRTGSDGRFRLTTRNPNDGAIPGEYKVVVTFEDPSGAHAGMGGTPEESMRSGKMVNAFKGMSDDLRKQAKGGAAPKQKATKIPAVYGDEKTTTLKATVPADGDIDLDLRSKGG